MSRIKLMMEVKEDAENLAASIGTLLDALESDEELEEVKTNEEEKTYELEEVRKILADKSRAGYTAQIRDLLQKHGAKKLSEMEPKNYRALLDDVEKLQ